MVQAATRNAAPPTPIARARGLLTTSAIGPKRDVQVGCLHIPVAFLPSTPLCITAQAAKIMVVQPVESDSPTLNMEGCYGEEGKEGESG